MKLLLAQPHRFSFDAAIRVLMRASRTPDPQKAADFRTQPGRSYPAGEIISVVQTAGKPRVTVAMMGLIGAGGVLPRFYEALAGDAARRGSTALHDFVDVLSNRMVAFFGRAGIKYRLHRSAEVATPDPVGQAVLALTGFATPGLVERLEAGPDPLLHYAGLFAMRPRSAERLAALVSDWLGYPTEVRQFAGTWLTLPTDQRTSLPGPGSPGSWNQLGGGAAIGVRSWDPQAQIVLQIGPLDGAAFAALLPDQPTYRKLIGLIRAFLGPETAFAINPVLSASSRFPLQLVGTARLGWNTWSSSISRTDACEALFEVK